MLTGLARDARLALRSLRRRPGFAAAFIATLALGIGANTAIFTVVRGVLLRPLPFAGADRLFTVYSVEPGSDRQPFSIADFLDLRAGARSFEFLAAWGGWSANLTGIDEPAALKAQWTSSGFFRALGVHAALGRTPSAQEELPGAARVALLGDGLWRTRFGGDPGILGRVLTLNGEPYTVIGVLPRTFPFFAAGAELVSPLSLEADPRRAKRASGFLRVLGRLRAGTSPEAAAAELNPVVAHLRAAYPDTNAGKQGVRLEPLAELVVGGYRRILIVLQAAVALVLLIACTNLASLSLARVSSRRPELALRAALGARRRDLLRQLLVETALLASAGGALSVFVAFAGVRGLLALGPTPPRASEVAVDAPVLLLTFGLTVAAALALGVAPALQGSAWGPADGLRGASRGATDTRRRVRARGALVSAEVALSLVLLVGAGLLLRTLHRLRTVDPGFRPDHLLTVQLSLPKNRYATPESIDRFARQAIARLSSLPGVADASASSINPLTPWRASIEFTIEGRADIDREKAPSANYRAVEPGYLRALRLPLVAGRDLDPHDGADSTPVVLISQTLARRHFPGTSPLGARLQIDDGPWRTVAIVGVVGDVKHTGLDAEPTADVYVPYAQTPPDVAVWLANIFCLAVRTHGEPASLIPAVQREIRALDRDVATSAARPMEEAFSASLAERRFNTLLLELFGAAALALALAGIYALTAFSVIERTREIGVRLSLGSTRRGILALIARQALTPVLVGLVCGVAGALALSRLVSGLLVGVAPHDTVTLGGSCVLLALAAAAATAWPALRATRIDPVRALRAE